MLASPNELIAKPTSLSTAQAGALPLAGLTAWQALVGVAEVSAGQRVLIQRAAGGVGHLAVQIAKALGAYVIGTASAAKHDFVRSLGADEVVDYTTANLMRDLAPVDVVFDLLGGDDAERSAAVLAPSGIPVSAILGNLGITPERAAELGIQLRLVSVRPSAHDLAHLVGLANAGKLRVHVDHAIPLKDVGLAHGLIGSGRTTGKIVLVP